ncbi:MULTISPECIES: GGDEF domain-containing response regulator [Spirulina sp. CCY15215]|uniref:two-component system response regulator n=1 Tax=Spirulina sp. CCY15215 TaxID=2767591 RepID=UPI00194EC797|nr:GGDEF domain-containing response regulator [Spirulina major]
MNRVKADILLVDDTPDNLRLLSTALSQRGYKVRVAIDGNIALMGANANPPDLILLDICMPGMNGYEVCKHLKANLKTAPIPIIFMSALDETLDKIKAFRIGGVDYITKPFQFEEVIARIESQLTIRRLQLSLQTLNKQLEKRVRERTFELEREVLQRKQAQEQLLHLVLHDTLTQLPNRSLFIERLEEAILKSKINPNYSFVVMFLDCDRFKQVNDSLGHNIGDRLLVAVGDRLQNCLRTEDTLARLGGDEFAILLDAIDSKEEIITIAERINHQLSYPFYLYEYEVFISISIGIVVSQDKLYRQFYGTETETICYQKPEQILRDADIAMYRAKALGKARYEIFNPKMHRQALNLLHLENDLRWAFERQEFMLYYQPIISLIRGKIIGCEALIRWNHPQRGLIYPDDFIPVAEEMGLILPLGDWILKESCQQLKKWHNLDLGEQPFSISVNMSARQFSQANPLEKIEKILQEVHLENHYLKLEITESVLIDHPESIVILLEKIKARKISISLDDFGTGYSSLSYLHRFPIDTLKIDRSFIHRLEENGKNLDIVKAIISLAHNLGMEIIAEGIETISQLDLLRSLGCGYGQGYFFARPLNSTQAEKLLTRDPQW